MNDPFRNRTFTPVAPADRPHKTRRGVRVVVTDGTHVLLRKPEQTALGGPPEEARRVEIRVVD